MPPSKTVQRPSSISDDLLLSLVQTRLKAINNIGKITSSMKMIASTKLNRAQKAMEVGREYGQATVGTHKTLNYTILVSYVGAAWWCHDHYYKE